MLDIVGLLLSFIMLIVLAGIQIFTYDDFKDGIGVLIAWALFLAVFISSAYSLIK